jgi:SulP family sulfate permease
VRAVAIAAGTFAILFAGARISRAFPAALLAVVASAAAVWALGWERPGDGLHMLSEIPRRLPHLTVPAHSFAEVRLVAGASLAIAILGMVEAVSIGRAVSAEGGRRFEPDRELAAKGLGNVAGAFTGCLPTSASWTRSALNLQMGARTRWVGVVAGVTVLVIVLVLAPLSRHVPEACLGAVVVWIGVRMFDLGRARWVFRWSRADGLVLVCTWAATLLVPIQYAIYFGVVLSLAMLVRRVGALHLVEMVEATPGTFREIEIDDDTGKSAVVLLQLEGDLFFGVVEELEERLGRIAANGARAIVVRMKRAHAIDATAAEALAAFAARYRAAGGRILLCGLKADRLDQIRRSQLGEALGADNLLATTPRPFASVRQALDLARRSVGERPTGMPVLRRAPRGLEEPWSYTI